MEWAIWMRMECGFRPWSGNGRKLKRGKLRLGMLEGALRLGGHATMGSRGGSRLAEGQEREGGISK